MKHLFIVNPVAGGKDRTAEVNAAVQAVLGPTGLQYEVYVTKGPWDAEVKIKADAATEEDLRVFAVTVRSTSASTARRCCPTSP